MIARKHKNDATECVLMSCAKRVTFDLPIVE